MPWHWTGAVAFVVIIGALVGPMFYYTIWS